MELKELACKNCGAPLKADNVVERLAMARCGHCHAVFALDFARSTDGGGSRPRAAQSLPAGFSIEDMGNSLEIRHRWFSPVFIFMLFFSLFWNGFMIVWHVIAIGSGAWIMSAFGLLHTAVGVVVGYVTLAGFVNTTTIRIGQGMLEVHTGPLPWPGNLSLAADEIRQVFCHEKITRGKNGPSYSYEVHAILRGEVRKPLLKGLTNAEQALFIEQELERFLRIADQSVVGELPR